MSAVDPRREILNTIIALSTKYGVAHARSACDQFLKMGLKSTDEIKRQSIPRQWVHTAWNRQNGRCSRCHKPMAKDEATGDHVIPISQNGPHSKSNIVAMCRPCNSSKNDNDLLTESRKSGNMIGEMFAGTEESDE